MRKKNFLMLALAAIAFAACSNEEIVPGGGNDGTDQIDPDGDAWVALSVRTPVKTRGLNTPNQENGTQDESTITAVKAVFFNGHLATSKVVKIVDFTTDDVNNIPNRSSAYKVPNTAKSVLIVANPQNLSRAIALDDTYDEVNDVITLTDPLDVDVTRHVAKSGGFVMTNAKGDLEPSTGLGAAMLPADLTLHSTPVAATNSPLTIRIDRVSAKVRVYVSTEGAALSTTATIDKAATGWYLNVTNKKFFPASKRALTFKESWTPYDQYEIGSYRVDPNYTMAGIGEWVSNTDHAKYDENYYYVSSATTLSSISWNALAGVKYCLENTQVEAANTHAYTTHVLLKVSYAPKALTNLNGSTFDMANGDDWFSMNGVFYTTTSILNYIEDELVKKYKDGKPAEYPTKITDAYNAYISALNLTPVTIADALQAPNTAEEQAAAYKQEFSDLAASIATASEGGKSLGNVEYYSKGLCYYKIMIKHDNDDDPAVMNKLGEFGVVRNSVYDITVSKIENPGYPIIPDPEPGTPDEELDRYLSIQIETNPWTWYTQEVEL